MASALTAYLCTPFFFIANLKQEKNYAITRTNQFLQRKST